MAIILGIDPGATGGVFRLQVDEHENIVYSKMMTCSSSDMDTVAVIKDQVGSGVDVAVVEQVSSFPGQGVSSTFTFGRRYGVILGVLHSLKCNTILVRSQKWQKDLGMTLSKDVGSNIESSSKKKAYRRKLMKESAFSKSLELFSECDGKKITKENSDAALIALWGSKFAL